MMRKNRVTKSGLIKIGLQIFEICANTSNIQQIPNESTLTKPKNSNSGLHSNPSTEAGVSQRLSIPKFITKSAPTNLPQQGSNFLKPYRFSRVGGSKKRTRTPELRFLFVKAVFEKVFHHGMAQILAISGEYAEANCGEHACFVMNHNCGRGSVAF